MKKFEMMEDKLVELLKEEGYEYFADGDNDGANYHISYVDGKGVDAMVEISIYKNEDKYHLSTAKENDEYEPKNQRTVKSLKAVSNYLNRTVMYIRG